MTRTNAFAALLSAAILAASPVLTAAIASAEKLQVTTESALVQTAGKAKKAKKGKPAKAAAAESCGTYMYMDKKTGKCADARNKK